MANVRKIEQHLQLCNAAAKVARLSVDIASSQGNPRKQSTAVSEHPNYKPRHTTLLERDEEYLDVKFEIGEASSPTHSICSSGSYTELQACTITIDVTESETFESTSQGDQCAQGKEQSDNSESLADFTPVSKRNKLAAMLSRARTALRTHRGRRHCPMTVTPSDQVVNGNGCPEDIIVQTCRPQSVCTEEGVAVVSTL